MTGAESRSLHIGARVYWQADNNDAGTVTEKSWSGVTIRWDGRGQQVVLHNDMAMVTKV